jgi:hypothetical protein
MNRNGYIIVYLFIFIFVSALPVYAQDRYSELERDLQLSESQRMQIEETKRKYMDDFQDLNQKAINKRLELRELNRNQFASPERRERLQRELRVIENSKHNLYNYYRANLSRSLNQNQRNRYNSYVDSERKMATNRPGYPPMNRSAFPPSYRYQRPFSSHQPFYPHQNRVVGAPPSSMYRPVGPPLTRPMGPPNRHSIQPMPRGYGR